MAQANLPEMPAGPVLELYGQRKRFTVPVGLKCMLEELTREVSSSLSSVVELALTNFDVF